MKRLSDPDKIAGLFNEGAVMIFPTDTVAGLGCRFDSEEGVNRIRELKGVGSSSPLAVLISSIDDLNELQIRKSRIFKCLVGKLWPGGLTVVLSSENKHLCCGKGNTLGLRMPDAALMRTIINKAGAPIAATSANIHGGPPPARIEDVKSEIIEKVDYVADIPVKGIGFPSTVVRLEAGNVRIIREGVVSSDEIFSALKEDQ